MKTLSFLWVVIVIAVVAAAALSVVLVARSPFLSSPSPSLSPRAMRQSSPSTQPKITWSENQIEVILSPGETATQDLTFTSSLNVQNIVIEPVPEIAPFMSVQPHSFANVPASQPQSVRLSFSIPAGTTLGTYDGTVHVRLGSQTLPQILKVFLNVWASFRSEELGYQIAYPPPLTATLIPTTSVLQIGLHPGDTEFPGVWIYVEDNPRRLTAREWWNQGGPPGPGRTEVENTIVVNGTEALHVTVTEGELVQIHVLIPGGARIYHVLRIGLDDTTFQGILSQFRLF